jgi:hypothetical protein
MNTRTTLVVSAAAVHCPTRFTRAVRPGRHLLRVRALDAAGNASAIALVKFSR